MTDGRSGGQWKPLRIGTRMLAVIAGKVAASQPRCKLGQLLPEVAGSHLCHHTGRASLTGHIGSDKIMWGLDPTVPEVPFGTYWS